MSWTLEVASNAAASSWTDRTSIIDRRSIRMGGQAQNGEAGSGYGFDLADDAAGITLPVRRCVRFTIDSTVVGRGRIVNKGVDRGTRFDGDARQFDVQVADGNSHLQGIPIRSWSRPAETDVARVTALVSAYLSGSPRASTDLATTYVASGDTVSLPKKRYTMTDPLGILTEIAQITGKLFFVTVDDELFYDDPDSTAYAATLSVTDVAPDSVSSFAPISDGGAGTQDGTEFFSGATLLYGSSGAVTDTDATAEAAHDYWRFIGNAAATTSGAATRELAGLLDSRAQEEERFTFALKLTDAQIDKLKYGQTLSFRSAAAAVTSARVIRASRVEYEEVGDGIWYVHVEGGFPEKLQPRLQPGKPSDGPFEAGPVHWWYGTFTYGATAAVGGGAGSSAGAPDGMTIFTDVNAPSQNFPVGFAGSYAIGVILNSPCEYHPEFGLGRVDAGSPSVATWGANVHPGTGAILAASGGFVVTGGTEGVWSVVSSVAHYTTGDCTGGGSTVNVSFWVDPDGWVPDLPNPGQQVVGDSVQEAPDGSTTLFTLTLGSYTGYAPGSLHVTVNGVDLTDYITETDPDAGTFTFDNAPPSGSEIDIRSYVAGNG